MNAVGLFLADGKSVTPHLCGKCGRIWESADSAERCCKCSFCGGYSDWNNSTAHDECSKRRSAEVEAENLANAKLVADYAGPFLINDRFCHDIEDLFDCFSESDLPEFGFCLDEQPAHIDISNVIEAVSDQMHEDWEEEPCEELEDGIAAWNKANEANCSYFECTDRKWSRSLLLKLHTHPSVSEHSEIRSES